MFEHTRNNRRQTFDRVRSPVLLLDVSDAMGPALDRGGTIRAKLVHALAKSSRALGVNDELPPMHLLDSFGKGAHDSPHTRDYPSVGASSRQTTRAFVLHDASTRSDVASKRRWQHSHRDTAPTSSSPNTCASACTGL